MCQLTREVPLRVLGTLLALLLMCSSNAFTPPYCYRQSVTAAGGIFSSADCSDNNDCNKSVDDSQSSVNNDVATPVILKPYLPATDPDYMNTGPIGQGTFVIERTGPPRLEELTNENILKIVTIESTDLEVNTLVWKCLGYRFVDNVWTAAECFPKWREKYSDPPDLIGMQRLKGN